MKLPIYSAAILLCLNPAITHAAELHDLDILEKELAEFLGHSEAPAVDRRLRLAKCPEKVIFEMRSGAILVSCERLNWRFSVRLRNMHARSQIVIARGQPVLMTARRSGFAVSNQMIADKAGSIGDMIPVRKTRRSAPVVARITGAGRVEIPQF